MQKDQLPVDVEMADVYESQLTPSLARIHMLYAFQLLPREGLTVGTR